jgi:hypothetical protein
MTLEETGAESRQPADFETISWRLSGSAILDSLSAWQSSRHDINKKA